MVIIQLTSEQLTGIIHTAVRTAIADQLKQPANPPTEKPLSVTETAKFLNLEPATIYGLVHKREIPFQKPTGSKRLYFFESELSDWLKAGRKKTAAEMATDAGNYLRKGPKAKGSR